MSKQTSLDWFFENIKNHFQHDGDLMETVIFTYAIAKKKEKQQIVDAWCDGAQPDKENTVFAEQYYNETYNNGTN